MCCNEKLWKKLLITISTIALILILLCVCMGNSNGEIKSILSATAKEGDNTQIGETLIKFSTNEIIEGNAITHEEGSDSFIINESGIYQISYTILFSSPITTSRFLRPISVSTRATFFPRNANAAPRLAVVVVLPTPPLPDVMTITSPICSPPCKISGNFSNCIMFNKNAQF